MHAQNVHIQANQSQAIDPASELADIGLMPNSQKRAVLITSLGLLLGASPLFLA